MSDSTGMPPGVSVLERGWLSSNNILFAGDGRTAVVDTGYATHAGQTLALIEAALGTRPLQAVINTHLHSDHCGGNAALASRYPSAQVLIPPGLAQHVRQWDPVALTYEPTGQRCPAFSITGVLEAGNDILLGDRMWEVHSAPGHDQHSVILFEPRSRVLISADALWENGFGVVFQELEGERAFDEVAKTLDLIESLQPAIVIPGHGRVFVDAAAALQIARRRLAGFVSDPKKHAHHAAKVLLKFKLLELQQLRMADFMVWAKSTSYFTLVHQRWFASEPLEAWVRLLLDDLVRVGAAERDADVIRNL